MNPARTFGIAAILGDFTHHWLYWLGPILGGICASIVYQMILKAEPVEPVTLPIKYDEESTKEEGKRLSPT
jgi:aquaporin related protein